MSSVSEQRSDRSEDVLIAKLDVIKDLRSKTQQYEKLKARILNELQAIKNEDKHISDYRHEIESLLREKAMHLEALQFIQTDLNLMERTIKEAENEREKMKRVACHMLDEYRPLKNEIDIQRSNIGLEKLPDIPEDIGCQPCQHNGCLAQSGHRQSTSIRVTPPSPQPSPFSRLHRDQTHPPLLPHRFVTFIQPTSCTTERPRRQQVPPMKTCSSCQQQIHRNAPVCPLCKAKSASKNPKKLKRSNSD